MMLGRFFRNVTGVAIIVILSSLSFFIANIVLGRFLTKADYGCFSLLRAITFILPMIVTLGMDASFIRYFSKNGLENFYWWKNLKISEVNTLLVSLPLVIFFHFYYNINWLYTLLVYFIICIYSFFLMSNAILRINSKYEKAQFLTSGWRIIFLFFCVILLIVNAINKNNVILSYFVAFVIFLLFAYLFLKRIPLGGKFAKNIDVFHSGALFYLITMSGILMTQLDKFFVGKMLGLEELGVFTAVSLVILTTFNLMGTSVGYVLMPYLAKGNKVDYKKLIAFILLASVILTLLFILFGNNINHFLFKGKYDGYQNLINIFILVGICEFVYNFIYFILGGIGIKSDFIKFIYWIGFALITFVIISIVFIPKYQLVGAAFATLVAWAIRDTGGIIILASESLRARK